MPISLQFTESKSGLYRYHYIARDKTIEDADWPRLLALDANLPALAQRYQFGSEHREEAAVYFGFIWRLTEGLERFVIPSFYRDAAAKTSGLSFSGVAWEYTVEYDRHAGEFLDKGFQPARNPPAGLFKVGHFTELLALHSATAMDSSLELNIFGLRPERGQALVDYLNSQHQPKIDKFLTGQELFCDVVLGVDQGEPDSILIKSPTNMLNKIGEVSALFEKAVTHYEQRKEAFQSGKDYYSALIELAEGKA